MATEYSFDVVSKIDMQELTNAVHQATKEIEQRFDLKGSNSSITLEKEALVLSAPDEMKLRNIAELLEGKCVKRGISLKALDYGKIESSLGGAVRQVASLKQGIDREHGKTITTLVKNSKLKINAQIQDDQIRISGKNKDDLQAAMKLLKSLEIDLDLQYLNFR